MKYFNFLMVLVFIAAFGFTLHLINEVRVVQGPEPRFSAGPNSLVTIPAGSHVELASNEGWFAVELSSSEGTIPVVAEEKPLPVTQIGGAYFEASLDCPPTDRCLISGRAGYYYGVVTPPADNEKSEVRIALTFDHKRKATLVSALFWLVFGGFFLFLINYEFKRS